MNEYMDIERATPSTRREDRFIWQSEIREDNAKLRTTRNPSWIKLLRGKKTSRNFFEIPMRRQLDKAGYRTTHMVRGKRVPMYLYMMEDILDALKKRKTIKQGQPNHTINNNTVFIGTNFTELNGLRNIPINNRVYLVPDVNGNGKIKHVYNANGLLQWLERNGKMSPFTRRPITFNDIRTLHSKATTKRKRHDRT